MKSLLKFILRHSNFLVFLLLEVGALLLVVNNNDYPHSRYLSTANKVVAWNYRVMDAITSYFGLRHTNLLLAEENAMLRNELTRLQNLAEDSIENSYQYAHLQQYYIPARVIQITTHNAHNYLTINKGEKDGIYEGMGVICSEGVVGIVRTVSEHFAIVIPTIHTSAGISVRMQKNQYIATVTWDGKNPRYANLIDVASHIYVEEGDTVVTSGLTPIFPANIPVGIVENSHLGEGDCYYTIRIKLATNYRQIEYVNVIGNPMTEEENKLHDGLD